jgi:hypothetical protein
VLQLRDMKNSLFLLCALVVLLISCQKEPDFNISAGGNSGGGNGGGGNGGGTVGDLLVRAVSKTGADSVVITYGYDAAKRLILEKIVGISQGVNVGNEQQIIRNGSGIITKMVQKSATLQQAGLDSIVTVVYYDANASRYISRVQEISFMGFSSKDSTVFIYDAGGKIIRQDEYQSEPVTGSFTQSLKTEYTYAANGNLDSFKQYDLSSGTASLLVTAAYTYDGKVNPLRMNYEAFVIGKPELISANNVLNVQVTDLATGAGSLTITTIYAYNNNNKPSTGVSTQTPGNIISNIVYYYQ